MPNRGKKQEDGVEQPKVLIAEDELIVGQDLCDTMEEAGFTAQGPHENVSSGMLAVQADKPDLAILDINLEDGQAFGLAETLLAEDVPVIFHSGHVSPDDVRARFPDTPALSKPCPPAEMISACQQALRVG